MSRARLYLFREESRERRTSRTNGFCLPLSSRVLAYEGSRPMVDKVDVDDLMLILPSRLWHKRGDVAQARGVYHDMEFERWANRVMSFDASAGEQASHKDSARLGLHPQAIGLNLYATSRKGIRHCLNASALAGDPLSFGVPQPASSKVIATASMVPIEPALATLVESLRLPNQIKSWTFISLTKPRGAILSKKLAAVGVLATVSLFSFSVLAQRPMPLVALRSPTDRPRSANAISSF
jgi:hypothetical protein